MFERHRRSVVAGVGGALLLVAVPATVALGGNFSEPPSQRIQAQVALDSEFTYQGRLTDNGQPATGSYDIRFTLHDSATAGNPIGGILTKDNVPVAAGLFAVTLDFGTDAFDGEARWIEISVKPGNSGNYTILSPRQPVLPVPQALYAKSAGAIDLPAGGEVESTGAGFGISQLGSGDGLSAMRGYTGDTAGNAIEGENSGAGAGVAGRSTYASGVGVRGEAIGTSGIGGHFKGKVGLLAEAADSSSNALDVRGPVVASGNNRFAFVHVASEANTHENITWFTSAADGEPEAVVVVSRVLESGSELPDSGGNVSVAWIPEDDVEPLPAAAEGKWAIVADADILEGAKFAVIVVRQAD